MQKAKVSQVSRSGGAPLLSKTAGQRGSVKVTVSQPSRLSRTQTGVAGMPVLPHCLRRAVGMNALLGILAAMGEVYGRQRELESEWQAREKETFERGTRLLQEQIQQQIPVQKAREMR